MVMSTVVRLKNTYCYDDVHLLADGGVVRKRWLMGAGHTAPAPVEKLGHWNVVECHDDFRFQHLGRWRTAARRQYLHSLSVIWFPPLESWHSCVFLLDTRRESPH